MIVRFLRKKLEAPSGFEPEMEVLQFRPQLQNASKIACFPRVFAHSVGWRWVSLGERWATCGHTLGTHPTRRISDEARADHRCTARTAAGGSLRLWPQCPVSEIEIGGMTTAGGASRPPRSCRRRCSMSCLADEDHPCCNLPVVVARVISVRSHV